jgi:ElaB/YqjD/DUF883 family membrane-anchored ribosome-binding protein
MTVDLKPYFDAVNAAEAEVQRVAHEIDELFRAETDESKAEALEMKPLLDAALAKQAEADALYEAMQMTNRPNDAAKNFVPVSTTSPDDAEGHQPSVIKRQEYDRLSLVDRAKFIRSGGTIED